MNIDDADVGRCLRYFTDFDREEIDELMAEHQSHPEERKAHRQLATELTRLVFGENRLMAIG